MLCLLLIWCTNVHLLHLQSYLFIQSICIMLLCHCWHPRWLAMLWNCLKQKNYHSSSKKLSPVSAVPMEDLEGPRNQKCSPRPSNGSAATDSALTSYVKLCLNICTRLCWTAWPLRNTVVGYFLPILSRELCRNQSEVYQNKISANHTGNIATISRGAHTKRRIQQDLCKQSS